MNLCAGLYYILNEFYVFAKNHLGEQDHFYVIDAPKYFYIVFFNQ